MAPPHPFARRTLKELDAASAHLDAAQLINCGAIGDKARRQKNHAKVPPDHVALASMSAATCNKTVIRHGPAPVAVEGNDVCAAGEFEFLHKDRDRLLYAINLGLLSF